jgi:hypothetical protein
MNDAFDNAHADKQALKQARHQAAVGYVRRIRNPKKRSYGVCYLQWLDEGCVGNPPPAAPGLSLMASQAVRLALSDILADR